MLHGVSYETLRPRFKQRCEESKNVFQNWQIRVHRSLSWMKRAAVLPEDDLDLRFMLLWVAFNSIYARWDLERNAPASDPQSRDAFCHRLCDWDSPAVKELLRGNKGLVKKLVENFFLSNVFWRSPGEPAAKTNAVADAAYIERNLQTGQVGRVFCQVCDRLYVMRGQLMHGAATGGGRLNRQTLKYCLTMLGKIAPLAVSITIENGANDDWPELCYPPIG